MRTSQDPTMLRPLPIDESYMLEVFLRLLAVPSPTGYTDQVAHLVGEALEALKIPFELTRRGAIRATLAGRDRAVARAVVAHVDTLGAMVKRLQKNGRLAIVPIGTWSARFAEGARCTIFTDRGSRRGTILPLKASGHTFNEEIDSQPVSWQNVELRVDEMVDTEADLEALGFNVGDYVAIDSNPEVAPAGFINARHCDDKAGTAAVLAAAKAVVENDVQLGIDTHLLFTISEEVGSGASAALQANVAELLSIDNATPAPGQNSRETGVTIAMMDSSGPFDYHLTHKLLRLCRDHGIPHQRDVFAYYRTDAASAVDAGNDVRTALIGFGVDASHGHERVHVSSLRALAELLVLYWQTPVTFQRDVFELGPLEGFPTQPTEAADLGSTDAPPPPDIGGCTPVRSR